MEIEKIQEKIKDLEKEIQETPHHKATEHHIGKLKAKLAKLRSQIIEKETKKGDHTGFAIKKQGDATIVLVGFPSVGKSTLLNKLTNAQSKVAPYAFTTLKVIPGMLHYKGAQIQILDVPGLIQGAAMGKGRGKEVLSVSRGADLLLLMASVENIKNFRVVEKELHLAGVRINQERPKIIIEKRLKGGLEIANRPKKFSEKTIKALAQEFGILNAKITFQQDISQNQFIDALMGNRVYTPALKVLSKIDLLNADVVRGFYGKSLFDFSPDGTKGIKVVASRQKATSAQGRPIFISAEKNIGLTELKNKIFEKLNFIRIYLKESLNAKPSKQPLICKKGIAVLQAAEKISQELAKEIKGAKIKGTSADFPNQFVGKKHILLDKDEVLFVK